MKFQLSVVFAASMLFAAASAQVPVATGIQILRSEDARRYDSTLESLMMSTNAAVRERAALAAGRIGNDAAIPALVSLLEHDAVTRVRVMAVFAIGEVESTKGAAAILNILTDPAAPDSVRSRAIEAAGKIAAANTKDNTFKALGDAITKTLESSRDHDTVKLGLTAALRARPEKADVTVARFLTHSDARIRADAANTLARLRAKNANATLRTMLQHDADPVARANAARALGAAEDKDALEALVGAATTDKDSRVRISAIGALATLRDQKAADHLFNRFDQLFAEYRLSKYPSPSEQSELLQIATALARIFPAGGPARGVVLVQFAKQDNFRSTEAVTAALHVAPSEFMKLLASITDATTSDPRRLRTIAAAMSEVTRLDPKLVDQRFKDDVQRQLREFLDNPPKGAAADALPEILQAYAAYMPADLNRVALKLLTSDDMFVRDVAVGVLAGLGASRDNVEALRKAFDYALAHDKRYDDAQLSILNALARLDKKGSTDTFIAALNAPDYLVRKTAFEILADKDLQAAAPVVVTALATARKNHKDEVLPYSPALGTKLGQVLNSDADYRRALSRKDGTVKAVLTTEKGTFTIDFTPEEAPLTVDNFVKLARSGYFNGLMVHRVVPNFVVQDGDPRGDGNGGPGWSIRCEINMLPFDRGAVGMALSGKDTGGSQWFVDHSPQPHLDGGYTVFGHVNEKDMAVVDRIVRGDKILSVKIVEGALLRESQRTRRTK